MFLRDGEVDMVDNINSPYGIAMIKEYGEFNLGENNKFFNEKFYKDKNFTFHSAVLNDSNTHFYTIRKNHNDKNFWMIDNLPNNNEYLKNLGTDFQKWSQKNNYLKIAYIVVIQKKDLNPKSRLGLRSLSPPDIQSTSSTMRNYGNTCWAASTFSALQGLTRLEYILEKFIKCEELKKNKKISEEEVTVLDDDEEENKKRQREKEVEENKKRQREKKIKKGKGKKKIKKGK